MLIAVLGFGLGRGRAPADAWHGTRLEPPLPAQPFVLATSDGPLRAEDLRGRHVVLFFGYTRCPDACPTTLAKLTRVHAALDPALAERLQVLLVSVDPAHDSPDRLRAYVERFEPRFLGATGTPEALTAMTRAYGIHHQAAPADAPAPVLAADLGGAPAPETHASHAAAAAADTAPAAPGLIDHTAHVLVLDRAGRLALLWGPGITADQMVGDLRRLLRE